jgi:hypothetical protein
MKQVEAKKVVVLEFCRSTSRDEDGLCSARLLKR